MTRLLRVPQLVAAARDLQALYTSDFIHATATVSDLRKSGCTFDPDPEFTFDFRIHGIGHGTAIVAFSASRYRLTTVTQFTGPGIAYTEFYRGRHGNEELITLMQPLLEAKLLPLVVAKL